MNGMAYAWEPTLQQVAIWVPWLTVDTTNPGSQTPSGTFTATTEPNAVHAQEHISQAALMVGAGAGTIPTALYGLATAITALRAAIALAMAYPRDDRDIATALAAMQAQYAADWKAFVVAVDNAGGDNPATPAPVLYGPDPVPWGDFLL
jgi:hypothetical protein